MSGFYRRDSEHEDHMLRYQLTNQVIFCGATCCGNAVACNIVGLRVCNGYVWTCGSSCLGMLHLPLFRFLYYALDFMNGGDLFRHWRKHRNRRTEMAPFYASEVRNVLTIQLHHVGFHALTHRLVCICRLLQLCWRGTFGLFPVVHPWTWSTFVAIDLHCVR